MGKHKLNEAVSYWMAVKNKCHTAQWKLLLWNGFHFLSIGMLATTDLNGKKLENKKLIAALDTWMETVIWFLSISHLAPRGTLCSGLRHPASQARGYRKAMRGKSPNLQIAAWSTECLVGAVKPHWAHLGAVKTIGEGIEPHYLSKWQRCFPADPFTVIPWST